MPTFEDLKKASETAVDSQLTKQEGWVRQNRKPLIIGAAVVIALLAIWHFV